MLSSIISAIEAVCFRSVHEGPEDEYYVIPKHWLDGQGRRLAPRMPHQTALERLVYIFYTYDRVLSVIAREHTTVKCQNDSPCCVCIEDNPVAEDVVLLSCVHKVMASWTGSCMCASHGSSTSSSCGVTRWHKGGFSLLVFLNAIP